MAKKKDAGADRDAVLSEFRQQLALERFQEEKPQLWLQSQRIGKLVDIQGELPGEEFPDGSCFLYASTVGQQAFPVKRVTGIDLDTCQVTLEVWGDEQTEVAMTVLPLESLEWYSFPAKAIPVAVHFQGFTGTGRTTPAEAERPKS